MLSLKKIATAIFCLSAVIFFSSSAHASEYTVEITIAGLENYDLAAFDIYVYYDSTLLTVEGYTLATDLGALDDADASDWSSGDDGVGTLNLMLFSYLTDFSSQDDSFVLATITFSGTDADSAINAITISYADLSDENGDAIAYTIDGTNITASAVPEPATISLMAFGLMGLIGLIRKTRA